MANETITQLNPLTAAEAAPTDLIPMVDVSSPASPTGETKKMELGELANYVSGIASSSFKSISETFVQVSPALFVGALVRRSGGLFVTASAASSSFANVVGVIESVSGTTYRVVTAGFVNFGTNLVSDGTVFYLGESGSLSSVDPVLANPTYVSKPVFIGRDAQSGWFFNQRGLQADEVKAFTGQFSSPLRYNNGLDLSRGTGSIALSGSVAPLSDNQAISGSSFSLSFVIKPPAYPESGSHTLLSLVEATSTTLANTNKGLFAHISSSTALAFRIRETGGAFREVAVPNFIDRFGGSMTNVTLVRESGSATPKVFINGAQELSVVETSFGSPTFTWANYDLRNSYFYLNRNSNIGLTSQINPFSTYAVYLYNRALASGEINEQYISGLDQVDKWGSRAIITSGALIPGRRYRVVTPGGGLNTWYSTTNAPFLNAVGFEWLVTKDVGATVFDGGTLQQVGCNFALEPDSVQPSPSQWKDVSPSRSHLTQNSSGATNIRPMQRFNLSFRSVGGDEYLGIDPVNGENVLPVNFVINSFTINAMGGSIGLPGPTISIGTSNGTPNDRMGGTPVLYGVSYLVVVAGTPSNQYVRTLYLSRTNGNPTDVIRVTIEGYITD
jgi:hypothetical protein